MRREVMYLSGIEPQPPTAREARSPSSILAMICPFLANAASLAAPSSERIP
jgi:hypothetical protein